MKLIVALALSVNAFTPSTPGGAKPREKSFLRHRPPKADPNSDAREPDAGASDHRWAHAGARGAVLRADRVFSAAEAKGGSAIDAAKTALLLVEYQNEFTTEGGKLHDAVKESMAATGMLERSAKLADEARNKGVTIIHAPITFKEDASDNPNKGLGILAGCAADRLFTEGTWNADFEESMIPQAGDLVVEGKKGLDAFPGTNLEALLKENGIETLALCGFLTNCCVESSMRTAYEKGFNTVTLGVKIDQCVGAPDRSSEVNFSAMTRPSWLRRAVRNRHRHAIELASRRSHPWRGGRREDSRCRVHAP